MRDAEVTLQSLTRTIESLQDAIKRDGQIIGWNETRTRQALIDPVLQTLGWMDPSVITLEYAVTFRRPPFRNYRVDYAIHQPDARGDLIAFVEAKRMHTALEKEHRLQVFKYAKKRAVRSFILTNGDQWAMYEITQNDFYCIFEFSIRRQPASDCADLLMRHFPKSPIRSVGNQVMPERLPQTRQRNVGVIGPPLEVPTPPPHIRPNHNLEDILRPSEIHILPTEILGNGVDVPKGLVWLGISLVIFGIIGWISGVWKTEPVEHFFEYIGLFSLLLILAVVAYVIRRLFYKVLVISFEVLQLWRLFAPIKGNKPRTLIWIAISLLIGIGSGLVGGYFIGVQTADSVINVLATLGTVVFWGIVVTVLALVAIGLMREDNRKRYRRRR